ncbi:MAG: thioesterase family protein [Planctomycetota bacterium]
MSRKFVKRRRVEFRDTDMAGIVHFSVFFTYMEEAEHELLRELELGVICEADGRTVSFPRVNAECNYLNAIRFEENIDIEVTVSRIGEKSITWQHTFRRGEDVVAKGTITTVCCLFHSGGGRPQSVPIPQKIVEALQPFMAAE